VPTVHVQSRTRKKNGEWGKAQPAALAAAEIDQLPEDVDRQILSLLLGASDPYAIGSYPGVAARASFRLAGPLIERVLPLLAQSGRLHLAEADPFRARTLRDRGRSESPLGWDGGAPWVFRLEVTLVARDRIQVDGALVRDGVVLQPGEPDLLLSPQFLVVRGTSRDSMPVARCRG